MIRYMRLSNTVVNLDGIRTARASMSYNGSFTISISYKGLPPQLAEYGSMQDRNADFEALCDALSQRNKLTSRAVTW